MNPLKKGFLWLKHYIFSNTLHGTHSPFVYSFLENIVYKTNANTENSFEELIDRVIASRADDKVEVFINDEENSNCYSNYYSRRLTADENSIFIFKGIRNSKISFQEWKEIIMDSNNNISLDFFEIGILFFDKKKPKEHFTIYYK